MKQAGQWQDENSSPIAAKNGNKVLEDNSGGEGEKRERRTGMR